MFFERRTRHSQRVRQSGCWVATEKADAGGLLIHRRRNFLNSVVPVRPLIPKMPVLAKKTVKVATLIENGEVLVAEFRTISVSEARIAYSCATGADPVGNTVGRERIVVKGDGSDIATPRPRTQTPTTVLIPPAKPCSTLGYNASVRAEVTGCSALRPRRSRRKSEAASQLTTPLRYSVQNILRMLTNAVSAETHSVRNKNAVLATATANSHRPPSINSVKYKSLTLRDARMRWVVLSLLLSVGCAFKQFSPPKSLPSADAQQTFACAVEHLLSKLKTDPLRNHTVYVCLKQTDGKYPQVASEMASGINVPLLGSYSYQPVMRTRPPQEEDYAASLILQKLAEAGVCLTSNPKAADMLVFVTLLASGSATTIREFSYQGVVFYYSEQMRREVRMLVSAYNQITEEMIDLLRGGAYASETAVFLLKILGPTLKEIGGSE